MSWPLFIEAFVFIFLAALPGRTTFLMLIMAARWSAWQAFIGAALAFGIQSVISVALGSLFSLLTTAAIQSVVALLFIYFSIRFWHDSRKQVTLKSSSTSTQIRSSFLLVFAAEWGDVSQLAIASFSAKNHEPFTVWISATLALWLIAALAILVGRNLHRAVSPVYVQKIAAIGFAITGIYILVSQLLVKR